MIRLGNRLGYTIVRPSRPPDGVLGAEDLKFAYTRAGLVWDDVVENKRGDGHGAWERTVKKKQDDGIVGAVGEAAFARFIGVPLVVGLGNFSHIGDVAGFEVRGSRYVPAALAIFETDRPYPDRIAVAVGLDIAKPAPKPSLELRVRYWISGTRRIGDCFIDWYRRVAEDNLPQKAETERWCVPPCDLTPWPTTESQFALFDD